MKIILTSDVKGQGHKGDIIEVKDGYGMNFLVKKGLGVIANNENVKHLEKENLKHQQELAQTINEAKQTKEKLEKIKLTFKMKSGKNDQIFGSISAKQIYDILKEKKIDVDKKKIKADGINTLGFHNVEIELHKQVIAILRIELIKES